ncbi:tigger transposable element-derived protein 6-like [Rhizophagus clarus]|uniref:Tigger transposable element-derived protein 6-like n=2 Tax=Rhizophagus clarus TaxID=94130 RepID=A0A8H3M828_9GLOM|nr:tigger transposable element-derived protein 6-like [Rhizophagus clarus]
MRRKGSQRSNSNRQNKSNKLNQNSPSKRTKVSSESKTISPTTGFNRVSIRSLQKDSFQSSFRDKTGGKNKKSQKMKDKIQKHQLCLNYQKKLQPTQKQLAIQYGIKQNTVSDILRNKDKWLLVDLNSEESKKQRKRPVQFSQIEEAMTLWVTNTLEVDLVINTDILREKAEFFASNFEVNSFKASNGWISNFKKCHNMKEYVKWGEAASTLLDILDEERQKLHEIIKDYDLNDIFNCDETGLYWDLEPSKTLAIDNAPVHITNENTQLINVTLHFLPSNTTSYLQPCDAEIINSFKSKYQKLLVKNKVETYEILQQLNKGTDSLNIHDAIIFCTNAWNAITQETISNCWKYTGILLLVNQKEVDEGVNQLEQDNQAERKEIQFLIDQLPFDNHHIDAAEFIHIDDHLKSNEGLTDEEIISLINSDKNMLEVESDEEIPSVISKIQALTNLDDLITFFKYSPLNNSIN